MDSDKEKENNDGIIVLTQVVKPGQEKETSSGTPVKPLPIENLTQFDQRDNDLTKLVKDVVDEFPKDKEASSGSMRISTERVESILERVVTKLYSKKIEEMVMDTIERTVQAEIDKIKQTMKELTRKGPS